MVTTAAPYQETPKSGKESLKGCGPAILALGIVLGLLSVFPAGILAFAGLPEATMIVLPVGVAAISMAVFILLMREPRTHLRVTYRVVLGLAAGWLTGLFVFWAFGRHPVRPDTALFGIIIGWSITGAVVAGFLARLLPSTAMRRSRPDAKKVRRVTVCCAACVSGMVVITSLFSPRWWISGVMIVAALEGPDAVTSLAYSPDGQTLVVGGLLQQRWPNNSGEIVVWDTRSWSPRAALAVPLPVHSMAISPDGRTLAAACGRFRCIRGHIFVDESELESPGQVKLWNLSSFKEDATLALERGAASVTFSSGGTLLAAVVVHGKAKPAHVQVWETKPLREYRVLHTVWESGRDGPSAFVGPILFADDNTLTAARLTMSGSIARGELGFWDVHTGEKRRTISGNDEGAFTQLVVSADRSQLACAGPYHVELLDLNTGELARPLRRAHDPHVAFSPDGKKLAIGFSEVVPRDGFPTYGQLDVCDIPQGVLRAKFPIKRVGTAITAVSFSPDGQEVAVATAEGMIYVLRLRHP